MRWYMLGFGVIIWAFVSATGEYRPATATAQDKDKQDVLIKRGDYLVNNVSRCGDCDTPRKDNGELDTSKHLQGAKTWFAPLPNFKFKKWDKTVPDITKSGMASKWSEEIPWPGPSGLLKRRMSLKGFCKREAVSSRRQVSRLRWCQYSRVEQT